MNLKQLLFLVACFCTSALLHAQMKLSFNPTEGETYQYRFATEMFVSTGQEASMRMMMDMLTEMTIKESRDDEVWVDFSFQSFTMQVSSPMMSFSIDSEIDIETLSGFERGMTEALNAFIGETRRIVFGTDGSVKSISGTDAVGVSDSTGPIPVTYLSPINKEILIQILEQAFHIYANNEIRVGDSWSNNAGPSIQGLMGMSIHSETTYTLTSITDSYALIETVSASNIIDGDIEVEISGEFQGETKLDINTGMIISSRQEGSVDGSLMGGIDGSMEFAMNIIIRSTATLLQ